MQAHALMNDIECVIAADKAGFVVGHPAPLPRRVLPHVGQRRRPRLHGPGDGADPPGSGHLQPLPRVNHPAKVAEKVAMLDHLWAFLRVRHEQCRQPRDPRVPAAGDDRPEQDTQEIWEDVIAEFPKMWLQDEYEGYEGKYWSLPPPRSPEAMRAGGLRRRRGQHEQLRDGGERVEVLSFSVGSIQELEPVMKAYKKAIRSPSPSARSSTTTSW